MKISRLFQSPLNYRVSVLFAMKAQYLAAFNTIPQYSDDPYFVRLCHVRSVAKITNEHFNKLAQYQQQATFRHWLNAYVFGTSETRLAYAKWKRKYKNRSYLAAASLQQLKVLLLSYIDMYDFDSESKGYRTFLKLLPNGPLQDFYFGYAAYLKYENDPSQREAFEIAKDYILHSAYGDYPSYNLADVAYCRARYLLNLNRCFSEDSNDMNENTKTALEILNALAHQGYAPAHFHRSYAVTDDIVFNTRSVEREFLHTFYKHYQSAKLGYVPAMIKVADYYRIYISMYWKHNSNIDRCAESYPIYSRLFNTPHIKEDAIRFWLEATFVHQCEGMASMNKELKDLYKDSLKPKYTDKTYTILIHELYAKYKAKVQEKENYHNALLQMVARKDKPVTITAAAPSSESLFDGILVGFKRIIRFKRHHSAQHSMSENRFKEYDSCQEAGAR